MSRHVKGRPRTNRRRSACQKNFDKLVDGEARSPATATLTSLRYKSKIFRARSLQGNDFFSGKWDFPTQKSPRAHAIYLHCPSRQRRQKFFGEFRKTGEISRSNLWRLVSCSVRRQQVEPGTARSKGLRPSRALQVFNKLSAPGRTGGALHLHLCSFYDGPQNAARAFLCRAAMD